MSNKHILLKAAHSPSCSFLLSWDSLFILSDPSPPHLKSHSSAERSWQAPNDIPPAHEAQQALKLKLSHNLVLISEIFIIDFNIFI